MPLPHLQPNHVQNREFDLFPSAGPTTYIDQDSAALTQAQFAIVPRPRHCAHPFDWVAGMSTLHSASPDLPTKIFDCGRFEALARCGSSFTEYDTATRE